jgi:hypothetical protein
MGRCPSLSVEHISCRHRSVLEPTFLNLMANIQERVGGVNVRVGGTSLDSASMVSTLSSGQSEAVLFGTAIPVSGMNAFHASVLISPGSPRLHPRVLVHARKRIVARQCQLVSRLVNFLAILSHLPPSARHPIQRDRLSSLGYRRVRPIHPRKPPRRPTGWKSTRYVLLDWFPPIRALACLFCCVCTDALSPRTTVQTIMHPSSVRSSTL